MPAIISPPNKTEEDRLMDLEEVAEKLGNISTRSVRRLIARGDLPQPVKVLSSPRLYHSDVVVHLEGEKPFINVRASTTKNHQQAVIALHPDLLTEMRAHVAKLPAGELKIFASVMPP